MEAILEKDLNIFTMSVDGREPLESVLARAKFDKVNSGIKSDNFSTSPEIFGKLTKVSIKLTKIVNANKELDVIKKMKEECPLTDLIIFINFLAEHQKLSESFLFSSLWSWQGSGLLVPYAGVIQDKKSLLLAPPYPNNCYLFGAKIAEN